MTKDKRDILSDALRDIVATSGNKATAWAIKYAKYAIEMIDAGYSDSEIRVQLLYILNNITHWRGEKAKEVRATLKEFVNETSTHN